MSYFRSAIELPAIPAKKMPYATACRRARSAGQAANKGGRGALVLFGIHVHASCKRPRCVPLQALPLNKGIAQFYDQSSGLWEDMWGDHMYVDLPVLAECCLKLCKIISCRRHHGYYPRGATQQKSNREAQIDMIEESLRWAGVTEVKQVLQYK